MFLIPTSRSCLIVLSISASPFISNKAFGVSKLIGTILIPNPAAKITAFIGAFFLIDSLALDVNLISSSKYSFFSRFFIDLFTTPKEWPVVSDSIL